MFCPECGKQLNENGVCLGCGNTMYSVYGPKNTFFEEHKTEVAVICVVAVLVAVAAFCYNGISKENLHSELKRDWSRVESEDDTFYTLELDFSESYVDYNFEGYFFDKTILTMDYEVISGNKISVNGNEYKIEFNDDKTMMTITPALTSGDDEEYWFYH